MDSNGFVSAVKTCFNKYAVFEGRARRSEFWYFVLAYMIIYVGVMILASIASFFAIFGLVLLGFIVPYIAVGVRRMHDTDHSGWWLLCPIVPIIFACMPGTPGDNRFGSNPIG